MKAEIYTKKPAGYYLLYFVAGVAIFPFIYLAYFNLPLSDEFIAMHFRSNMSLFEYQKLLINAWSGRYTANLLEAIYPLDIVLNFYRLIPVLTLATLLAFIFFVARFLITGYPFLFSVLWLVILVNYAPSIGDLIFYTPAIIIYTISFVLLLILPAVWLSTLPLKMKLCLMILTEVLLLGTSEAYFPVVFFFSTTLLFQRIRKRSGVPAAVINWLITCLLITLLLSIHGNQNRLEAQLSTLDTFARTWNYLYSVFFWSVRFLPAVLFLVILVAYFSYNDKFRDLPYNISPGKLFIAVFGYLLLFMPLFFINLTNYKRLGNVFFFYFLVMFSVAFIKIIPRLHLYTKSPKIILILLILIFMASGNIKSAYSDIYHSYTSNYSKQLKARYQLLENRRNSRVVFVDSIQKVHYVLAIQDVNAKGDPKIDDLLKPHMMYYNIDTILLK